jgi:hypothetical protein
MVRFSGLRLLACAALLGASFAWPVAAAADDTATTPYTHFSTAITTVYGSQYPIAGHLDLQLYPSGIVRGYYHNAYQKAFIQVVGGRDGSYIWFDIGPSTIDLGLGIAPNARLHIVATMNPDGSFRGQAYPLNPGLAAAYASNQPNIRYVNSQNSVLPTDGDNPADQYIFASKPADPSGEDYPGQMPASSPSP